MVKVYILRHSYELETGVPEIKHIGIFSSEARAKQVINELKDLVGFCDYKQNFEVLAVEVDGDNEWEKGF